MRDRGVALIVVLLVMMALSALGLSLAMLVSTESRVTANYRDGIEVLYGAEAALERVLPDLASMSVSSFTDGPAGARRLPDGTFADLHVLTAAVNDTDSRWQLFGHGPPTGDPRLYALVWVADEGMGRLSVLAHAYGPAGSRRAIEATVVRGARGFTVLSWREVR